ncbi:hypothetical protein PRIC2_012755 [Phytophthora ramorum]
MSRREKQDTPEAGASQRMTRRQTRRSGEGADAGSDREKNSQPATDNPNSSMSYAPYRDQPRQEWPEAASPVYTRVMARREENTDPSTDNGESSGNSQETQQWTDTEGNSRPSSAQTTELSGDRQTEVPCRVTWCEHAGKRYGLCWAHGGVKKCCHHSCPKIALATGEFCSIHEREISAGSY